MTPDTFEFPPRLLGLEMVPAPGTDDTATERVVAYLQAQEGLLPTEGWAVLVLIALFLLARMAAWAFSTPADSAKRRRLERRAARERQFRTLHREWSRREQVKYYRTTQ